MTATNPSPWVTCRSSSSPPAVPSWRPHRPTTSTAAFRAPRPPLPFPTKKVKGTVSKQTQEEITNAQFAARAVEPHATQGGFFFFDISGISSPLPGSRLFLTGVRNAKGNELLYFEV